MKTYGVELSVKMMRQLFEHGIRGFHLCTLNLEKSVTRVLEALKWVEPAETRVRTSRQRVRLSVGTFVSPLSVCPIDSSSSQTLAPNGGPLPKVVNSLRPAPAAGASVAGPDIARKDSPASWDEFPNGRFGDARSPAYGEMDGYGVSLKLPVRTSHLSSEAVR